MRKSLSVAILSTMLLASVAAAQSKPTPRPQVNVNTATETQLMYLPGIGATLAGRIVEFTGGVDTGTPRVIRSADELLEVRGLGKQKLEAIRPYIVFTGETTATAKIRPPKTATPKK